MRKVGINLHAKAGLSDEEYIHRIAALGFTSLFSGSRLGSMERAAKIADLCAANGIHYETLHAPFDHINDMWLEGEGGDAMLRELTACVDACVIAGVDIAVVHLSSGDNAPSITDLGRARFSSLVDYAAKKGVRIAFENQRKLANLSWAFETFTDTDTVGFCWDCGHENCFTPGREYMPLFGDRLICTHIHDNSGIYNEDLHLIPFDGTNDFERIAGQLRRSSFQGSLMLEVIASVTSRYDTVSVEDYLQKAYTAISRLAAMVE